MLIIQPALNLHPSTPPRSFRENTPDVPSVFPPHVLQRAIRNNIYIKIIKLQAEGWELQTPRWAGGNKKHQRLDSDCLLCQDISLWVREASCNRTLGGFMCLYYKKKNNKQNCKQAVPPPPFFLLKKDNDGSQEKDIFKNKWQQAAQILTSHVKAKRIKRNSTQMPAQH